MSLKTVHEPAAFVRYSPTLDTLAPEFDRFRDMVVAGVDRYVAGSAETAGSGRAVRFAHAKGYGLLRGEVEILADLPAEYAQGIYAVPRKHDAVVRFSNGSPYASADAELGNAMGMAIKLFGVDGPTLLEDEPDSGTFDYNNINAPVFFANTAAHYKFIAEMFVEVPKYQAEGKAGKRRFLNDFLTGKGTLSQADWAWDELLAFTRLAGLKPCAPLVNSYWTMGAVRHGDYVAKLRFAPAPGSADAVIDKLIDKKSAPDAVRLALISEIDARPHQFDIQVQLCTDLDKMPVEDVTMEWAETLSPFVTVAKLTLPQQDIGNADNIERMDALSFTPWRTREAHAPLGDIQRVRKEVYRRSSVKRHEINHQRRVEPRTIDEVFE